MKYSQVLVLHLKKYTLSILLKFFIHRCLVSPPKFYCYLVVTFLETVFVYCYVKYRSRYYFSILRNLYLVPKNSSFSLGRNKKIKQFMCIVFLIHYQGAELLVSCLWSGSGPMVQHYCHGITNSMDNEWKWLFDGNSVGP